MKKRLLIILLVVTLIASACFSIIGCDPKKPDPTPVVDPITGDILTPLPDMVDYGANADYYKAGSINYSTTKKNEWKFELDAKQDEERADWYGADTVNETANWPKDVEGMKSFYVSFGPWAADIDSAGVEERQSNVGYFNNSGTWVDDESANTVTRIFTYATAEEFIERMDKARLDESKMDKLVDYIVREDVDRDKGVGYTYNKGTSSALEDYAQLEELEEIYEDVDAYLDDDSYVDHIFYSQGDSNEDIENKVEDAINRKKRKIYGEIFTIFEDKPDQFARCAIATVSYAIEILEDVMVTAYNNEFEPANPIDLIDYMRNEVFDHETLSYLLAFMDDEITKFNNDSYEAIEKKTMMSLYGYYYQYQKRDYEVWDDDVMVENKRIGKVTEYEDFLELGHHSSFDPKSGEVTRYTAYDRRQYAESYRYSEACYQKFYTVQLTFQGVQENKDRVVYVGGAGPLGDTFNNGQYGVNKTNGITVVGADSSYAKEMQRGCTIGLGSTLIISDINWEYSADANRVQRFNQRAWDYDNNSDDKLALVKYEIVQLESQDYTLNHAIIAKNNDKDLTQALQYQIRAYSADSIRTIQSTKKDEVTCYLELDRFLAYTGHTHEEIINNSVGVQIYELEAFAELEENAGRNDAKLVNVEANYTPGTVKEQENKAADAGWPGVRENVKYTLHDDRDYDGYASKNTDVDEYFQNTLIRKVYSCGASLDSSGKDCNNGDNHATCEEVYDTNWALSRLLDTHEVVLRYMAGQAVVTFKQFTAQSFTTPTNFYKDVANLGNNGSITSTESIALKKYAMAWDSKNAGEETLETSDQIGFACCNNTQKDEDYNYPTALGASEKWAKVPMYDSLKDNQTKDGTITLKVDGKTYIYTFIGWCVDETCKYMVELDEAYNYDLRLYPCYRLEVTL